MLSEEANEFFTAETLVDRLDAWADFAFVAVGSACKYMANRSFSFSNLRIEREDFEELSTYITTVQGQMMSILIEEFRLINPTGNASIEDILEETLMIVISANEAKGTELNGEGKVQKPIGFIKPEQKIDTLLCKALGNYRSTFN